MNFVAMEEDLNAHCLSKTDEAVNLASDLERLPENSIEACSLNGPSIHIESKLSNREELHGFDSSIAHVKLNKMLDMHEEQKPPGNSVNFCLSLEPYKDDGLVYSYLCFHLMNFMLAALFYLACHINLS